MTLGYKVDKILNDFEIRCSHLVKSHWSKLCCEKYALCHTLQWKSTKLTRSKPTTVAQVLKQQIPFTMYNVEITVHVPYTVLVLLP